MQCNIGSKISEIKRLRSLLYILLLIQWTKHATPCSTVLRTSVACLLHCYHLRWRKRFWGLILIFMILIFRKTKKTKILTVASFCRLFVEQIVITCVFSSLMTIYEWNWNIDVKLNTFTWSVHLHDKISIESCISYCKKYANLINCKKN